MTQKTVGYVELEWTCSRCGTRNLGTVKTCTSCGAAMEAGQKFELPPDQQLIADQAKLETAAKGPDIHCGYCGARNPAGTERCVQCGGDLREGKAREAGQVLGAFQTGASVETPCPFCGTPNPANALKCQKCGGGLAKVERPAPAAVPPGKRNMLAIIIAAIAVIACIGVVLAFTLRGGGTKDTVAVVESIGWERSIPILALQAVQRQAWIDEIPAGAPQGDCVDKMRSIQNEPVEGAKEVCGTPYTIDQGSGVGKVVQDCQYEVYDQWCAYSVQGWMVIDTAVAKGSDLNPQWPTGFLQAGQREGDNRQESYVVTFRVEDETTTYQYAVPSAADLANFAPGSRWTIEVGSFGRVTNVEPAP